MPAKTDPKTILEQVKWIEMLPDSGGSWGKGLIETGKALRKEVDQLIESKQGIETQIRNRLKVLRAIPARADREAALMFNEDDIATAKEIVAPDKPGAELPDKPPKG